MLFKDQIFRALPRRNGRGEGPDVPKVIPTCGLNATF